MEFIAARTLLRKSHASQPQTIMSRTMRRMSTNSYAFYGAQANRTRISASGLPTNANSQALAFYPSKGIDMQTRAANKAAKELQMKLQTTQTKAQATSISMVLRKRSIQASSSSKSQEVANWDSFFEMFKQTSKPQQQVHA